MSLYRKYRPQSFEHLVGQDHVSITLSNALKLNKVNHAYLFTGPRGTGKTTTARIMAKSVNCVNLKEGRPCEQCEICNDINEGKLIDVIEIDAASNRGIDEMRDLKEKINFAPTRARNKVYIIDEVHMLTKEAFNALLKTLEEPPESVFFILATTEVHKIPETILSRCQRFDFRRIDLKTLVSRLKYIAQQESIEAEEKALELIADHAQGGMRDAIGLMEQISANGKLTYDHVCDVLGISGYASIERLYTALGGDDPAAKPDLAKALAEIGALFKEGFDLINFNKNFLEYLRKRLLASVENNSSVLTHRILKWIDLFQKSFEQSRHSPIAQLPLELAIVEAGMMQTVKAQAPAPIKENIPQRTTAPVTDRVHAGITAPAFTPQKSPISTDSTMISNNESAVISIEQIRSKWKDIVNEVKLPSAKQAIMQGKLIEISGHNLKIGFSNNFYMGKVKEAGNHVEIESAFERVLNVSIKIVPVLGVAAPTQADTASLPVDESALTKDVLEIFGGEVVQ